MRNVRPRRRGLFDVRRVTLGDYIILAAALLMLISLFLPWISVPAGTTGNTWAFTKSELAAVVVIIFFLATLFLVIYPLLSPDMGFPPLPFSTPVIFMLMGALLLLVFTYELGKYSCFLCPPGYGRGVGIWLGLLAAIIFIVGAVIKWGSRPTQSTFSERPG